MCTCTTGRSLIFALPSASRQWYTRRKCHKSHWHDWSLRHFLTSHPSESQVTMWNQTQEIEIKVLSWTFTKERYDAGNEAQQHRLLAHGRSYAVMPSRINTNIVCNFMPEHIPQTWWICQGSVALKGGYGVPPSKDKLPSILVLSHHLLEWICHMYAVLNAFFFVFVLW